MMRLDLLIYPSVILLFVGVSLDLRYYRAFPEDDFFLMLTRVFSIHFGRYKLNDHFSLHVLEINGSDLDNSR